MKRPKGSDARTHARTHAQAHGTRTRARHGTARHGAHLEGAIEIGAVGPRFQRLRLLDAPKLADLNPTP
jgi:hypothetical protein